MHRPTSLGEALELRSDLGAEANWYAGGTELLTAMKLGIYSPRHLIDTKLIHELSLIDIHNQNGSAVLSIGATVTHQRIAEHPGVKDHWPAFGGLENEIGNIRVRTAGTLSGNLAFADPRSDPATFLLALDARIVIKSPGNERMLAIDEFLLGPYATAIEPDEIISEVRLSAGRDSGYVRFRTLERPTVGVAVAGHVADGVFLDSPRVVVGSANEKPALSLAAGEALAGVLLDSTKPEVSSAADAAAEEIETIDDISGSSAYRSHLIRVLLPRAVDEVLKNATNRRSV